MDHTTVPRTWRPFSVALFLVPALLGLSSVPAAPCGMSTHGEVCTRAAHYFASPLYPEYERVVRAHPEAYQAGSSFPDWGYAFDYAEASEEVYFESSTEYYEEVHHGGGSVASLLMFFLIIPFVIAARGSLALFPRNNSDYKNYNSPLSAILFFL